VGTRGPESSQQAGGSRVLRLFSKLQGPSGTSLWGHQEGHRAPGSLGTQQTSELSHFPPRQPSGSQRLCQLPVTSGSGVPGPVSPPRSAPTAPHQARPGPPSGLPGQKCPLPGRPRPSRSHTYPWWRLRGSLRLASRSPAPLTLFPGPAQLPEHLEVREAGPAGLHPWRWPMSLSSAGGHLSVTVPRGAALGPGIPRPGSPAGLVKMQIARPRPRTWWLRLRVGTGEVRF
jgi:hypothetical protein